LCFWSSSISHTGFWLPSSAPEVAEEELCVLWDEWEELEELPEELLSLAVEELPDEDDMLELVEDDVLELDVELVMLDMASFDPGHVTPLCLPERTSSTTVVTSMSSWVFPVTYSIGS